MVSNPLFRLYLAQLIIFFNSLTQIKKLQGYIMIYQRLLTLQISFWYGNWDSYSIRSTCYSLTESCSRGRQQLVCISRYDKSYFWILKKSNKESHRVAFCDRCWSYCAWMTYQYAMQQRCENNFSELKTDKTGLLHFGKLKEN